MTSMASDPHLNTGALALDAMTDDEATEAVAHVADCESCAAELAGFLETAALLGSIAAEVPPSSLRRAVMAAIAITPQLPPVVGRHERPGLPGPLHPLPDAQPADTQPDDTQPADAQPDNPDDAAGPAASSGLSGWASAGWVSSGWVSAGWASGRGCNGPGSPGRSWRPTTGGSCGVIAIAAITARRNDEGGTSAAIEPSRAAVSRN